MSQQVKMLFIALCLIVTPDQASTQDTFPTFDSCKVNELSYEYYRDKFNSYIEIGNLYKAGIQIGNAFCDLNLAYHYIHKGLRQQPEYCHDYFQFYVSYKTDSFLTFTARQDISRWLGVYKLCDLLIGEKLMKDSLSNFRAKKKARVANIKMGKLGQNNNLIKELKVMRERDQRYRSILEDARDEATQKKLWKMQLVLDSINIVQLDSILDAFGYPQHEDVGHEWMGTPCLIMHHHPVLEKRLYYDSIIEKAVKDGILPKGNLIMFRRRTGDIMRQSSMGH